MHQGNGIIKLMDQKDNYSTYIYIHNKVQSISNYHLNLPQQHYNSIFLLFSLLLCFILFFLYLFFLFLGRSNYTIEFLSTQMLLFCLFSFAEFQQKSEYMVEFILMLYNFTEFLIFFSLDSGFFFLFDLYFSCSVRFKSYFQFQHKCVSIIRALLECK